jgi:tripartite-type tricarboxylate transporter receptor subunit TctC
VVSKDQFAAFDAFQALTGTHVWALPPGTSKDVVKALQSAFNEMTKSKAFIHKGYELPSREVLPITGEDLVKRVNALKNQPPA